MKKLRLVSLILCICLLAVWMTGCAVPETAMEYEGETVTLNMYRYWTSQIKSNYVSSSNDTDSYWDTKYANGETYEQKMREIIDFNVKINLVCQQLFKEMGLTADAKDVADLETGLNDLLVSYGSKSELNAMLGNYGINYNMLKEIYEIELKTTTVYDSLYGESGARRIDDSKLDAYYKDNYSRIDMIMIYDTSEYVLDENGKPVFDDTKNSYEMKVLTEEESKAKNALADDIMKKIEAGESFDDLKAAHNEDPQGEQFKDGYYISSNDISIYGAGIVSEINGMEIGDVKKYDDGNIIYIMKRKELTDKPYADENYVDQFENLLDYCEQADFNLYMEELIKGVKVYSEVVSKVSIRKSPLMK